MTRIVAFVLLLFGWCALSEEPPKTFSGFKQKFLNQQVVVNDVPFDQDRCLQWESAVQKSDGTYAPKDSIGNQLSITYRGQVATVIAIQLAPSFLQKTQVGTKNAFGENTSESDISNPYLEVVVRFADGTVGIVRGYPGTLIPLNMELANNRAALGAQLQASLPSLVGQKIYAVGYSRVYKPTSTVEELSAIDNRLAELSSSDIPLLQPLTITKARYLPELNAVILKVSFPSGSEGITYTQMNFSGDSDQDILSRAVGSFFRSIPEGLSPAQIDAIKHRTILKGMTADMVDYALGFKESENDWGRGGKQLIYFHSKVMVYLNSSGKVEDWQVLD